MRSHEAILGVDDEPNFCRILEAKLRRSSFSVSVATTLAAGLRCLLEQCFALILLDVRLPDADGIEALPQLEAIARQTPVVVMTAYEEEGLRRLAIDAGAAEVIYKPFDLDHLTA